MLAYSKQAIAAGFLLFVGLWIAGIVRGTAAPFPQPSDWNIVSSAPSDNYNTRRVANNWKQLELADTPLPMALDQPVGDKIQVFEKRAQIASRSSSFESDRSFVQAALAEHKAVVFNEKATGIEPDRQLVLEVNVPPEQFDALVTKLQSIGHLKGITVTQRDRTGEFRKLNAQRQTQKKYLEAILKIRDGSKASIEDALRLEQKILEIERDLQNLGVQLGDLLGRDSYYHVDITLVEFLPGSRLDPTFTWTQRIVHGFGWAIAWWFAAVAGIAVLAGVVVSVRVLWPRSNAT